MLQVVFKAHEGAVLAMALFHVTTDSAETGPLRLITSGAASGPYKPQTPFNELINGPC